MHSKMRDDYFILAFRQYTRAIISYNYFVKVDEESRHKYLYHEDRRLEHLRHFDNIGLDALEYLEKCLNSWPSQGQNSATSPLNAS